MLGGEGLRWSEGGVLDDELQIANCLLLTLDEGIQQFCNRCLHLQYPSIVSDILLRELDPIRVLKALKWIRRISLRFSQTVR